MILPREKQCVSLKTAKRMEKLGFRQDSSFFWRVYKATGEAVLTSDDYCKANKGDYEHYSAYTDAELGVILPEQYISWRLLLGQEYWYCGHLSEINEALELKLEAEWETEARGLMACHLKENNSL